MKKCLFGVFSLNKLQLFLLGMSLCPAVFFCPVNDAKQQTDNSATVQNSKVQVPVTDNQNTKSIMVELITGLSKPPFIIQQQNSGLQLDIIKAALLSQRVSPQFIHMPLGRNISGFQRWNVDGIITVPHDFKALGAYISKPYISYQNVAVSLAGLAL